jgi:methionine synthase II (cobalamin-independent)
MDAGRRPRATAVGSWPGTDIAQAVRVAFGELTSPNLPYLPELPGRGPWADMIGRGAALLVDLPVSLESADWRITTRPGPDLRRCRSLLSQDLDTLGEVAQGFDGPVKIQVIGPWTLAAQLWVPSAERAVVDPGARRDVIASLTEGVLDHLRMVRRLLPMADPVLQLDEPSLPAVISGALRSASGMRRLPAVEGPVVSDGLRTVVDAVHAAGVRTVVLHSCAGQVPVPVLSGIGLDAVNLDITLLSTGQWEEVAALVESGTALWPGLVPVSGNQPSAVELVQALWRPWRDLGLDRERLSSAAVTPVCGLAGLDEVAARSVLTRTRQVVTELTERVLG